MALVAQGSPTKEFFVGMLTRDIELSDAILDLLDNCLDGVVRQRNASDKRRSPDFYKGYFAHISIEKDKFIIEDNCGGIPREVAEKYAFRMGRSSEKEDDDLPTVGIYGIGMKRAIFKIGREAEVWTRNNSALYRVSIPNDWSSRVEWDFPIDEPANDDLLKCGGTKIEISELYEGISINWDSDDKLSVFCNNLIRSIQQSYSLIIQKGFSIEINNVLVQPLPVNLLISDQDQNEAAIKPYLYQRDFGDVSVSLAVGFYAPPPSPEEIDDENALKRSSSDAGWTVVCNDRVVLYNDKSHLTGWGEAGVPQYHTQFIGIRGFVVFESTNPKNLPMTTTKRGVDTSSEIYAAVKDHMRKGLKMFTDYTNRWKGRNESERVFSTAAKSVPIDSLLDTVGNIEASVPVKFRKNKEAQVFTPTLPTPRVESATRRISFSKDVEEILDVVEYFYMDREHDVTPSQIGEKCFDEILKLTRT